MNKFEIEEKINSLYKEKLDLAKLNYNDRFNKAMQDPTFSSLYTKRAKLITDQAYGAKNSQEIQAVSKELLDYINKNNINLNIYYSCQKCKDTGYINNHECECRKAQRIKLLRENSRLPVLATNITFKSNKIAEMNVIQKNTLSSLYLLCQNWVNNFSKTKKSLICILGQVGIGKTTLALSIANELLEQEYSVFYATAFDINNIFVDKKFNKLSDESLYDDAIASDLLIIDDLGVEVSNTIGKEYLFNVIDSRTNNNKKTIICSNLNMEEIESKYDTRIASRLSNKENTISIGYIIGNDLRK